ncbi:MAG: tRNA pseudouridine(55) synthase TruB [Candidatus Omnitrophota bacterium]|nr:tRNA pseudouridine(55) synthase TruB [Candidatus Omnitrophota bacterium]MBU1929055.1 tRNA pseudouridine(55) synthase TruB [Candidatus Omnitrophota bacterium]MBU2034396.1 tRNA pseudouridine(55) synthase TruB [Candidatus Omnitrophota bacterium]MBU2221700.1 tRNA pseudouridine(55) synthase TruB [Candidatus Omnitrophota bacterium]MBU2258241.1 tRNA pseudouridine(55) synthase TruB [Candidatus Omnitrophota bacterium]
MIRDGILVINKPKGITSHDVVDFVRKKFKIKQVGHSGTLDPIATGVLVILIGKCTKLFNQFLGLDKEYSATLTLGARTNSGDIQGEVIEKKEFGHVTEENVNKALSVFIGENMQVPPMVSALKHKGKRLYDLAREGKEVKRLPRKIVIKEISLLKFSLPDIQFKVKCSRGTYVRQLAEDIAAKLGCVGFVSQIERLSIGRFNIKDSLSLTQVDESRIQPTPIL